MVGADGRAYAPANSRMHADDGFDRNRIEFEAQFFHIDGAATLPHGATSITVWRGMEYRVQQSVTVRDGQEFHTSYWGHMGLIGLKSHLLVPDYSAYPDTAAARSIITISRIHP